MRKLLLITFICSLFFTLTGCDTEYVTEEVYLYDGIEFTTNSIKYVGDDLQIDEVVESAYLELDYTAPVDFCIVVDIETTEIPDGLELPESMLLISQSSSTLQIPISGTPTTFSEEASVSFTLTFDEYSWDCTTELSLERPNDYYNPDAGEVTISNVKLTCPLVASTSSDFSEEFILTFDYENGSEYSLFKLISVDGLLTVDPDELASNSGVKAQDGDHSAVINLGYNFFSSSSDTNYTALTSTQQITLTFSYNTETIETTFPITLNDIDGFVWDNYTYKISKESTTKTWIDRNVGATSIVNIVPDVASDGTMSIGSSGFEPNFRAYGSYFQYGRATGLPLILDKPNPIDGSDIPYINYDGSGWDNGSWESVSGAVYTDGVCWNDSATGGTNNPCPTGFRVPTRDEITQLIKDVAGTTSITSNNNLVIPAMVGKMNFGISGLVNSSGPSTANCVTASVNRGEPGAVGLRAVGYTDSTDTLVFGEEIPVSDGTLLLATCEVPGDEYGRGYYVKVYEQGKVTTLTNMPANSMIVRCVSHQ